MLARIALRSLGRFVTSMHKSFPDSSATIVRKHLNAGGQDGSAAGSEEDKEVSASLFFARGREGRGNRAGTH